MATITLSGKGKDGTNQSMTTSRGELTRGVFLTHTVGKQRGYQRWEASNLDEPTANMVLACRFREIDPNCDSIQLPMKLPWTDLISTVNVSFVKSPEDSKAKIEFNFTNYFENWANPYSIKEYSEAVQAAADESGGELEFARPIELRTLGFRLRCGVRSLENTIRDEVNYWSEKVKIVCTAVVQRLLTNVRRNSLTTFFDFPAPIRTSCQQYLIYFVQFLEDLGIKADSEIKEDAGRVLFSVTPKEGPEALGRIKEALEIYLALPRNPDFDAASTSLRDFAVVQLRANVLHLQSQLILAQATIQAKDAAIQALDLTVYQQRQLIGEIGRPKRLANPPEQDEEAILGDTIHITQYEGKGFKVDLPRILRQLKRKFGRNKSAPPNPPSLPGQPESE